MPLFTYKAIDVAGKTVVGRLDAINLFDLEQRLSRMELDLVAGAPASDMSRLLGRGRIKRQDLINFCFHLEQLTSSGVPLMEGLVDLRDSVENPRFRQVVSGLIESIEGDRGMNPLEGAERAHRPPLPVSNQGAAEGEQTGFQAGNKQLQRSRSSQRGWSGSPERRRRLDECQIGDRAGGAGEDCNRGGRPMPSREKRIRKASEGQRDREVHAEELRQGGHPRNGDQPGIHQGSPTDPVDGPHDQRHNRRLNRGQRRRHPRTVLPRFGKRADDVQRSVGALEVDAAIAIGIGVPYGVHVVNRFVEDLSRSTVADAVDRTLKATGVALAGSALTTLGAFVVLSFSGLPPMRTLGLLGGVGIAFALLAGVLVEPGALVLWARRRHDPSAA